MLNLDTHILLYALQDELTRTERATLARHRWGISSIVLWEIAKLHHKGRISIGLEHPLMAEALANIEIWPIDQEVCRRMLSLDFTSDPANELIAATSLAHHVPLMTRDTRIRASKMLRFA
jgi:PIN domain nuclease of toxin-antitoxin system